MANSAATAGGSELGSCVERPVFMLLRSLLSRPPPLTVRLRRGAISTKSLACFWREWEICRVRAEGIATGSAFARRGEISGRAGMRVACVFDMVVVVEVFVVVVEMVAGMAECPIVVWQVDGASAASACGGDDGYLKSPDMMTISFGSRTLVVRTSPGSNWGLGERAGEDAKGNSARVLCLRLRARTCSLWTLPCPPIGANVRRPA
jgi:hypothetical protein